MRSTVKDTTFAVQYMDSIHNRVNDCISGDETLIRLVRGRPDAMIHGGSHLHNAPHDNTTTHINCYPMSGILAQVKSLKLVRPATTV